MTTLFCKTFVSVAISCRISSSSKVVQFESQYIGKSYKMQNFAKYSILNTP